MILMSRKNLIITVLVLIIVGAMLARVNRTAGFVMTLVVMVFYLAIDMIRTLRTARHLRRTDTAGKLRVSKWAALLAQTHYAAFLGYTSYFLPLDLGTGDQPVSERQGHKRELFRTFRLSWIL